MSYRHYFSHLFLSEGDVNDHAQNITMNAATITLQFVLVGGGHYNHQTPLRATDIVIYSGDLDSCGTKRQNEAFFRVRLRFIITAAVPRKKIPLSSMAYYATLHR